MSQNMEAYAGRVRDIPLERVQHHSFVRPKRVFVDLLPLHSASKPYTGKVFTVNLRHHRDDQAFSDCVGFIRSLDKHNMPRLGDVMVPPSQVTKISGLRRNLRLLYSGPQQPLQAQAVSFCAFSIVGLVQFLDQVIDVPVAVLVRFGGICGGFAVAVLQLGSRSVSRQSRRLLERCLSFSSSTEWWLLQLLLRSRSQCKLWRRPEIPWCSSGWLSTCRLLCK